MKKQLLIAVAITVTITGCTVSSPPPSEQERFYHTVTQNICNVDSLSEEKNTALDSLNNSLHSVARHQNKHGTYKEETYTLVEQKMLHYKAELEASYKFATQMCGAYSQCVSAPAHHNVPHGSWGRANRVRVLPVQRDCGEVLREWRNAQSRFSQVAIDIHSIDATVEIAEIKAKAQIHRRRKHRTHHPQNSNKECCGTLNNIFTDCCN